jgi:hypothetical protein
VLVTAFLFAPIVEAKNGGNGKTSVRWQADLDPCCATPEPNANGEVDRRIDSQKGAVKDNRFTAEVYIPLPNVLGIDASNARSKDIRLILSRANTDYAECRLVFDDISTDPTTGQTEVEYKLDLRVKKKPLKARGSCDGGLPTIENNDVVTAVLVVNPADRTQDIDLLQGIFGASDD